MDKVLSEIERVIKPRGKVILDTGLNTFLLKSLLFLGTLLTGIKTWESRKYHVNEQNFFSLRKILTSHEFSTSIKIYHGKNWLYGQIRDQDISKRVKDIAEGINKIYDLKILYAIRQLSLFDIFLGTHFLCLCIKQKG